MTVLGSGVLEDEALLLSKVVINFNGAFIAASRLFAVGGEIGVDIGGEEKGARSDSVPLSSVVEAET